MPELGESVTEGTITKWLKSVGDTVEIDEPLLEVSTDKVDTEIPSPVAGTIQKIVADEDETVDVGATLAVIGDGASADAESQDEGTPEPAEEARPAEAPEQAEGDATDATGSEQQAGKASDTPEQEKKAAAKAEAKADRDSGAPAPATVQK